MAFKKQLEEMKIEYPFAKEIEIGYSGNYGNMDEFRGVYIRKSKDFDFNQRFSSSQFIIKYYDLLIATIATTKETFKDDGAEGTIHIDLVNDRVWAEHSSIEIIITFEANYELDLTKETKPQLKPHT